MPRTIAVIKLQSADFATEEIGTRETSLRLPDDAVIHETGQHQGYACVTVEFPEEIGPPIRRFRLMDTSGPLKAGERWVGTFSMGVKFYHLIELARALNVDIK